MNGIFPDYIGPDISYRFESLYPDWIGDGILDVTVPDDDDAFEGGGGKSKIEKLEESAHGRRLLREDQEIMAIIMVATRVIQ